MDGGVLSWLNKARRFGLGATTPTVSSLRGDHGGDTLLPSLQEDARASS